MSVFTKEFVQIAQCSDCVIDWSSRSSSKWTRLSPAFSLSVTPPLDLLKLTQHNPTQAHHFMVNQQEKCSISCKRFTLQEKQRETVMRTVQAQKRHRLWTTVVCASVCVEYRGGNKTVREGQAAWSLPKLLSAHPWGSSNDNSVRKS